MNQATAYSSKRMFHMLFEVLKQSRWSQNDCRDQLKLSGRVMAAMADVFPEDVIRAQVF